MPGAESLRQQQYYAHPRNLFWDFMGDLLGATRDLPYDKRLQILRDHHIALWDSAHRCRRPGSLDSNITDAEPNDFASLFEIAPNIHTIYFNGKKAEQLFRKLALPRLKKKMRLVSLPSTSPANASILICDKREAWNQVIDL